MELFKKHVTPASLAGNHPEHVAFIRPTLTDVQAWAKANGMALVPLEPDIEKLCGIFGAIPARVGGPLYRGLLKQYKALIKVAQDPTE